MTFLVNHAGAVYQKDLGPKTGLAPEGQSEARKARSAARS
jgi:hypothetical protein